MRHLRTKQHKEILGKMSAGTEPSSSSGGNDSQSGTQAMDRSIYVYQIPESTRISVCYYLDQNNVWEEAARKMGYNDENDLIVSLVCICASHTFVYKMRRSQFNT